MEFFIVSAIFIFYFVFLLMALFSGFYEENAGATMIITILCIVFGIVAYVLSPVRFVMEENYSLNFSEQQEYEELQEREKYEDYQRLKEKYNIESE